MESLRASRGHRFFLRSVLVSVVAFAATAAGALRFFAASRFFAAAASARGAPSGKGSGALSLAVDEEAADDEADDEEEAEGDAVEAMCQMSCTIRHLYAKKVMPTACGVNTQNCNHTCQQIDHAKRK